uniref:Zinc transporter ZIP6 n=1 Tax=Scophthalmus maximus TaxID=52904 RepID=A0A8D2ZTQ2_SCOMX
MLAPQVSVRGSSDDAAAAYTDEDCENKCHSHFHDTVGQADSMHHHHHDYHHILHHHHSQNHHPHSHSHSYSEQHFQQAGVATLAWMVIMGDGLHNFSDGLAIGAAFTEGLSSGLSTSVAVFCHELPHELGDFAVLLKAGMTVRQAILYNVLSAMMAYLGMVTGILIGHYAENISMWIFALTAGLFMYVALVDMVSGRPAPERTADAPQPITSLSGADLSSERTEKRREEEHSLILTSCFFINTHTNTHTHTHTHTPAEKHD